MGVRRRWAGEYSFFLAIPTILGASVLQVAGPDPRAANEGHVPTDRRFAIMETIELTLTTGAKRAVVDLTARAAAFVRGRGDGLLNVFVPHATAGLAIVELGARSDEDLLRAIDDLLPATEGAWAHRHGSPGHGRDHVLPAFVAPSVVVPVFDGTMALGTWQSLALVDTNVDNPERTVRLSFLAG